MNQIQKYGKQLFDEKISRIFFLKSLVKNYDDVVATIEQSKDLSVLTIDELLGSLQSHEDRLKLKIQRNIS